MTSHPHLRLVASNPEPENPLLNLLVSAWQTGFLHGYEKGHAFEPGSLTDLERQAYSDGFDDGIDALIDQASAA